MLCEHHMWVLNLSQNFVVVLSFSMILSPSYLTVDCLMNISFPLVIGSCWGVQGILNYWQLNIQRILALDYCKSCENFYVARLSSLVIRMRRPSCISRTSDDTMMSKYKLQLVFRLLSSNPSLVLYRRWDNFRACRMLVQDQKFWFISYLRILGRFCSTLQLLCVVRRLFQLVDGKLWTWVVRTRRRTSMVELRRVFCSSKFTIKPFWREARWSFKRKFSGSSISLVHISTFWNVQAANTRRTNGWESLWDAKLQRRFNTNNFDAIKYFFVLLAAKAS